MLDRRDRDRFGAARLGLQRHLDRHRVHPGIADHDHDLSLADIVRTHHYLGVTTVPLKQGRIDVSEEREVGIEHGIEREQAPGPVEHLLRHHMGVTTAEQMHDPALNQRIGDPFRGSLDVASLGSDDFLDDVIQPSKISAIHGHECANPWIQRAYRVPMVTRGSARPGAADDPSSHTTGMCDPLL